MTQEELMGKLEALKEDTACVDALANAETMEDIQSLLKSKGIDLTLEQVNSLVTYVNAAGNGELDEGKLEDVSGGGVSWQGRDIINIGIGCINYGIAIGNKIFNKNAPYIGYYN